MKIDLKKNKKYLLACSYGPDSMSLFDILFKNNYVFSVANVNYNLRKESKKEQEDLKKYCKKNGIDFFGLNVEEKISKNIEEKCREIRYEFFSNLYKKHGFDGLLIAHNEDDLLETYLLQKKRGGIVSFYGLQKESFMMGMNVYRPLLSVSKIKLLEYDELNNVPYAIDSSNLEDKYERNKIRHQVTEKMPKKDKEELLKEIKIKNLELLAICQRLEGLKNVSISDALKLSDFELSYYLTYEARKCIPNIEFSKNRIQEFRKILSSKKPNVLSLVKDNVYFIKSYNNFEFKPLNNDITFCYILDKPGKLDTPYFKLDFSKGAKDRNVNESDYPLFIRNATKKDVIKIKDYKTSMRREFINWKMPKELRNRWPIIENKNHEIIYIPRYSKNFRISDNLNFVVKI